MLKKSGINGGEVMNTFLLQIEDNSCACLEFWSLELPNVPLNQFNTTTLCRVRDDRKSSLVTSSDTLLQAEMYVIKAEKNYISALHDLFDQKAIDEFKCKLQKSAKTEAFLFSTKWRELRILF